MANYNYNKLNAAQQLLTALEAKKANVKSLTITEAKRTDEFARMTAAEKPFSLAFNTVVAQIKSVNSGISDDDAKAAAAFNFQGRTPLTNDEIAEQIIAADRISKEENECLEYAVNLATAMGIVESLADPEPTPVYAPAPAATSTPAPAVTTRPSEQYAAHKQVTNSNSVKRAQLAVDCREGRISRGDYFAGCIATWFDAAASHADIHNRYRR